MRLYCKMCLLHVVPLRQLSVADPGDCNRCVCNGHIFLNKMLIDANLCHSKSARIAQCPQTSSYNLIFKFVIQNYSIIAATSDNLSHSVLLHPAPRRRCACFYNSNNSIT